VNLVFSVRRVPGTLALAFTNLIAALSFVDSTAFGNAPLFETARDTAPLWVWAGAWFCSGLGLIVAALRRSLAWLHFSGGWSFAIWTAMTVGIAYGHFTDPAVDVSPVAAGLLWWVLVGQASMLIAPLWRPKSDIWWHR
jgi:hypothetical protein